VASRNHTAYVKPGPHASHELVTFATVFKQAWLPEIVFFFIGGIFTLILTWLLRPTKTLDWELLADEPIVSAGSEYLGSKLTVEWEGGKLENPRLISLRVFNSGKREVLRDEFESGIDIVVPDAPIVAAYVTDSTTGTYPKGPVAVLENASPEGEDLIQLRPQFLNRDGYVDMQIIVDGGSEEPTVEADFAGRSRPMRNVVEYVSNKRWAWAITLAYLALAANLVLILLNDSDDMKRTNPQLVWLILALLVLATLMVTVSVYYRVSFYKRRYRLTTKQALRMLFDPITIRRRLRDGDANVLRRLGGN
jgi:hypothetical protein